MASPAFTTRRAFLRAAPIMALAAIPAIASLPPQRDPEVPPVPMDDRAYLVDGRWLVLYDIDWHRQRKQI